MKELLDLVKEDKSLVEIIEASSDSERKIFEGISDKLAGLLESKAEEANKIQADHEVAVEESESEIEELNSEVDRLMQEIDEFSEARTEKLRDAIRLGRKCALLYGDLNNWDGWTLVPGFGVQRPFEPYDNAREFLDEYPSEMVDDDW